MRAVLLLALSMGVVTLTGQPVLPADAARRLGPPPAPRGAILFGSYRDGERRFYAVNADGTGMKQLPNIDIEPPRWSPDGRVLAFRRFSAAPCCSSDITLVDSMGRRDLDTGGDVRAFSWSPDSQRIAYSGDDAGDPIMVIHVATGRKTLLTQPRREETDRNPRWSPDGRSIAFTRFTRCCPVRQVTHVISADGSRQRGVILGQAVWTPDSKGLLVERRDGTHRDGRPMFSIWLASADGRVERRFLRNASAALAASPRGNRIALVGEVRERPGLYVIGADGRALRPLLVDGRVSGGPVWSPDGRTIAVSAGSPGDVVLVDIGGGPLRTATEGGRRHGYANTPEQWHPRGLSTEAVPGTSVSAAIPTDSVAEPRLLRTRYAIDDLAADGSNVAITYVAGRNCLEAWNPATGSLTRFPAWDCGKPTYCCALGASGIADLTVADGRVAWVYFDHFGGRDSIGLLTATIAAPGPLFVSFGGTPVLDLHGDGGLLAFDTWTPSCPHSFTAPCSLAPKRDGVLWRLDGERFVRLASSTGAITPLAVDSGRILVERAPGTLEMLTASGTAVRSFVVGPTMLDATLQARDLVVLRPGVLSHYDVDTGGRVHEWPVSGGDAKLVDLHEGIAVYLSGGYVHLLSVANGRDVALPVGGRSPIDAELEAVGLFRSYRTDGDYQGRVEFIPMSELTALLGAG